MKKAIMVSLAVSAFVLGGCGKQSDPVPEVSSSIDSGAVGGMNEPSTPAVMGEPAERVTIPDAGFAFDPKVQPLGAAHKKYLGDNIEFKPVPMQASARGRSAVIGSNVAKFYPGARLHSSADLAKLPKGEPIPIGTFISGLSEIRDATADPDTEGLFVFEETHNYFYESTYRGRKGLVFGADLAGLDKEYKENSLTAFYYIKPRKSPAFYDHNGRKQLALNIQNAFAGSRIAFEKVGKREYSLSATRPDDLIALYDGEARERERSLFFTTDLFAHTLHLLFDHALAASEEEKFTPLLKDITGGFLEKVNELQERDTKDKPGYTKALALAKVYFQVPQALLRLAPVRTENPEDYMNPITYRNVDRGAVLEDYPRAVREEIALIDAAQGYGLSPNFKYREDYSQYKPRGHYTKNGVLSSYFRAMIWFGRIHLYMSASRTPVASDKGEPRATSAEDASIHLTPVAVIINKIAKENPGLLKKWRTCYDPITKLIGSSDDLSLDDVMPALDKYPFGDLAAWSDDPGKIADFLAWGKNQFPEPRIADNSVFFAPSVGNLEPAAGFRLFGQRFTYDSYIHMQVSQPRLPGRGDVRGLDIMKAFGSRTADGLLAASDYPQVPNLKALLDKIEGGFSAADAAFWGKTYYNRTLYLIKSQAQFERGQGFFFTETPAWNTKAMLSSHGTWAELRHDTILYVKQFAAEMGGFEGMTYRTVTVPRPHHYVEPNRYFFQNAYLLVRELVKVMQDNDVFTAGYPKKFEEYATIVKNLLPIVEAEIADRPITDEQNDYLVTIPYELAFLVLPVGADATSFSEDNDQFRMALIADVYTNAETGQVLETAVGIPYRMYVALNDGQGGKRIATGYIYSYYEFMHPMSDRMTDEQWKAKVYADNPDLNQYLPFWVKGILTKP